MNTEKDTHHMKEITEAGQRVNGKVLIGLQRAVNKLQGIRNTLQGLDHEEAAWGVQAAIDALQALEPQYKATESTSRERVLASKRAPIIAVDFDGTLCENKWPEIGEAKWDTIQALIAAQAAGARLILWTNRVGARLREAVEWARQRELEFDAVNENLPEILAAFGTDCRKVYADIYLDDRAAQPSAAVLEALWMTARSVMNEAAQSGSGEEEQE